MLNGPSGSRHRSLPLPSYDSNPTSLKKPYRCVPSVTGLGDAGPFTYCRRPFCERGASFCQRIFPVLRSRQITSNWSLACAVTKIRSAVKTGDECPGGSAVFQRTFLLGPKVSGMPVVVDTPLPFGPRNWDQSSAKVVVIRNEAIMRATKVRERFRFIMR